MLRSAVRGVGEVLISLGMVILLFVVYQLYWTGVLARQAMAEQMDKLDHKIREQMPTVGAPVAPGAVPPPRAAYPSNEVFGAMYIPRLGSHWQKPLIAGVQSHPDVLHNGLGWYESTALAGAEGNFAVAGHRKTYGDPFLHFPDLRVGDKVYVKDAQTASWYIYVLDKPVVNGSSDKAVYRTLPNDMGVIAPTPAKAFDQPGKYITLTTCDPEWGSSHRLIVWGHLQSVLPLSAGKNGWDIKG